MVIDRIVRTEKDVVRLVADMKRTPIKLDPYDLPEDTGLKLAEWINDIADKEMSVRDKKLVHHFIEYYPLRGFFQAGTVMRLGTGFKKQGGRYSRNAMAKCFSKLCPRWKKRLFVLTSEGFGYTDDEDNKNLKDSIFLDRSLEITASKLCNKQSLTFIVKTSSRKMKMKIEGILSGFCWLEAFVKAVKESRYCCIHKYNSFAPEVSGSFVKPYINGKDYFEDVADAMDAAVSKIYITGWMLSPGMYLKRPIDPRKPDNTFRLDQILLRAAKRGVKIYILLYKEFEHALPNASLHAKNYLQSLDKNISVVRHPSDLIMLWSHHEKLVVVDCLKGFMGGFDLCYGRYDTKDHFLCEPTCLDREVYFPGQDYNNARIKDFKDVHKWDLTLIDKQSQPRMPWRDVGVQLSGEVVKDVARHFIQYWNFATVQIMSKKEGGHLGKGHTVRGKTIRGGNKAGSFPKYAINTYDVEESSDEEELAVPPIKREKDEDRNNQPNLVKEPMGRLTEIRKSIYELAINPEFHMMKIEAINAKEDVVKRRKVEKQLVYISGEEENNKLSLDPADIGTIILDRNKSVNQPESMKRIAKLQSPTSLKELSPAKDISDKQILTRELSKAEGDLQNMELAQFLVEAIMHEE